VLLLLLLILPLIMKLMLIICGFICGSQRRLNQRASQFRIAMSCNTTDHTAPIV